jgi:hypothetical protein
MWTSILGPKLPLDGSVGDGGSRALRRLLRVIFSPFLSSALRLRRFLLAESGRSSEAHDMHVE